MEEGRTPVSQDSGAPTEPVEDGAARSSHETLILPKGSGVLESARAQAAAADWPGRLLLALLVFATTWASWMCLAVLTRKWWPGTDMHPAFALFLLVHLFLKSRPHFLPNKYRSGEVLVRRIIAFDFALTGLTFMAGRVAESLTGTSAKNDLINSASIALFALAALSGALLVGYRIFAQSQSRLSEWLVTLLAAILLVEGSTPILRKLVVSEEDLDVMRALALILSVAAMICGSAWAWSIARLTGEKRGRHRMRLMFIGWLFVLGIAAGTAMLVCLLVLMFGNRRAYRNPDSHIYRVLLSGFFGAFLMLPGLLIHRRAKRAAEAAKRRP